MLATRPAVSKSAGLVGSRPTGLQRCPTRWWRSPPRRGHLGAPIRLRRMPLVPAVQFPSSAKGMQAEGATARRTVSLWRTPAASGTGTATRKVTSLPSTWTWQSTASPR